MTTKISNRLTAKLFVGFQITLELGNQLEKSTAWKLQKIDSHNDLQALIETLHESHRYVGRFITEDHLTLKTFQIIEQTILDELREYIKVPLTTPLRCCVFSQLFVS